MVVVLGSGAGWAYGPSVGGVGEGGFGGRRKVLAGLVVDLGTWERGQSGGRVFERRLSGLFPR